ncbi:MAG: phosphoenolpyruvate--protein phosphotransferase [Pirellulales bacterium]
MHNSNKGIAVSPGVAVGTAYCIAQVFASRSAKPLSDQEARDQLVRYEDARQKSAAELRALRRKVETQVGKDEGAIFAAHEAILQDPAFTERVVQWITRDRLSAQAALARLLDHYTDIFSKHEDSYLRERLADIRDVVIRLSGHLSEVLSPNQSSLPGPLIVVTDELVPSQAVMLGDVEVKGIVTQRGSQTSHAAIVARSRGIPAVSGVPRVLEQVKTGDRIIVDGREGHVIVNPDSETLSAYLKLEREFFDLKDHLAENRHQPAVTADGTPLTLLANINGLADAKAAVAMGAAGVGLYRTEYLYLTHPDVPDEEEQLRVYTDILQALPGKTVTIRTLDIGGDKTVPYLGRAHHEANPFMGWRSIRLSFEHPEFFATQIRAILRAAVEAERTGGEVRLLFPMITTLEEMRSVRALVLRAARRLEREGKPHAQVPIGMMLEVPAAAIALDDIIEAVDFVSIGSNDLVQYLMAADRDNPKVSHLCQPLSPPVLRVLDHTLQVCRHHQIPVTLCGEMAGQPRAFVILLGMGLRQFSMSPAFVPTLKELAHLISVDQAQAIWYHAQKLKTATAVRQYLSEQMAALAPDLSLLDTA